MGNPEKTKKIIVFSIIGVVTLALILIIALSVSSSISANKDNLVLDGVTSKLDTTMITKDSSGNVYLSIEKIAPMLSYEFYNGEYGKATEDRTKCYVKNANELATFEMGSNVIYKLLLDTTDSLYEKYTLTLPVTRIEDKLYISLQGLQKAFNVQATYDAEKNVLTIYTLPYLVAGYDTQVKEVGYTSLATEYANQKAILNGLLVVIKDRQYYGVISTTGETVIGTKYNKIQYMEITNEFLVQSNNKYGVLTSTADTKIDMTYDELKVIDSDTGLYLAKSNNKYGILQRDGNILLYIEYDKIGIQNIDSFPNDDIKNPYILLDTAIPVSKDGKWGLYGLDGSKILAPGRLTTLGCVSSTNKEEAYKNVLIIPESEGAEGIVVGVTSATNKTSYGIYSVQNKRLLTPLTFTKIYRDVVNGETSYYMQFGTTISTVKSKLSSSVSEVGDGDAVVNVNPSTQPTNEVSNNIGNQITDNTIGTNEIGDNTVTDNTITGNAIDTNSDNVIIIDPNSTEPIVVQ